MGTYRFVLALLVALSHIPGAYMKSNLGASSVLAFYFLSGWLMAMSYRRFQEKSETPARTFFLDRAFKLWPSYMLVFCIALTFYATTGAMTFDWRRIPLEVFIIPNAFSRLIPWNEAHALVILPPTWSLGVEAIFYLTVPLLALLSYRLKVWAFGVLVAGHLLILTISSPIGAFITCALPIRPDFCANPVSDFFGLDFPIFGGVAFLAGHIAHERLALGDQTRKDAALLVAWAAYAGSLWVIFPIFGEIANPGVYDVLFAMAVLLPVGLGVILLCKDKPQPSWDRWLGNMAYPLFLTHFLARDVVGYFFGGSGTSHYLAGSLILSMLLAYGVMQFQQIIDRMRYRARGFSAPPRAAGIA